MITVLSAWYIYHEMKKARIVIWRRHRVALAQKGVALNELVYDANDVEVGGMDPTYDGRPMLAPYGTQGYNDGHEEVLSRPIGHGERGSYATPYDIAYDHDGEMSIYRVDAADAMSERLETEKRVSQHLLDRRSSKGSSAHAGQAPQIRVDAPSSGPPSSFPPSFPTAAPTGGSGLQRAPTDASVYSVHPQSLNTAHFPAPVPSHASHLESEHTAYSGPSVYSQPSAPPTQPSHHGGYV